MIKEKMIELNNDLIDYASIVESMINKSIKGLLDKNENLLREVMLKDEEEVNKLETYMDREITEFIAQYEPKAVDLRRALMMFKMSNDLERIGDHAFNICESAGFLIERPQVKSFENLPGMAEGVMDMLRESIESFVKMDAVLAEKVCRMDDAVDEAREKISKELMEIMTADPSAIERAMHLNRIAGNLERIADLSTNIGEDVIFIQSGRVIKHNKNI